MIFGSFSNLITQTSANANTIVQAPLMFVRGGYVYSGRRLNNTGYEGNYRSSVSHYGGSTAYSLYLDAGVVDPTFYPLRYYGFSVRCVALGG